MNTEDFVTYEQALALKKLGFDWEVNHFYQDKKLVEALTDFSCEDYDDNYTSYENFNGSWIPEEIEYSAPTLAQAQKWLREAKELIICIEPRFYKGKRPFIGYSFHINEKENRPFTYIESDGVFTSYEKALSAGITECLKLLEK